MGPGLNSNTTSDDMFSPLQGSFQSMNFYDATLTYLDALNETLMEGGDYKNGKVILNKIRNRIVFSCKLHYNSYSVMATAQII